MAKRKPVKNRKKTGKPARVARTAKGKNDTKFKPGQSGNPSGRPKGSLNKNTAQFRAWCREAVSQVEFLEFVLGGLRSGRLDTSLVKLILEQGHGRAPGAVDINVDFDHLAHLQALGRKLGKAT